MSNALFTMTFGEFDNNIFVHTIMDGFENMKTCEVWLLTFYNLHMWCEDIEM